MGVEPMSAKLSKPSPTCLFSVFTPTHEQRILDVRASSVYHADYTTKKSNRRFYLDNPSELTDRHVSFTRNSAYAN